MRASFAVGSVSAGTGSPTLVQARATATNTRSTCTSPITIGIPNPTLAGNCLILCAQADYGTTTAPTISDDQSSGIWSSPVVTSLISGGVRLDIFVGINCPAGITSLSVDYGSQTPTNNQFSVYEFYNVAQSAAVDGHSSGTTTAGTITTTANGDLVLCYGSQTSGSAVTAWTAGSAFQLLNASNYNSATDPSTFAECTVQSSAGAITPTAGGSSGSLQMVAVALKAASAGTAPSGIRVTNVQGYDFYGGTSGLSGPWTCQFPTRGNLIHLSFCALTTSATPSGFSGMSDSAGNTYSTNGAPVTNSTDSSAGITQHAKAVNSTPSLSNAITFNYDQIATGSTTHIELYDISGATAYAQATTAQGDQTVANSTLSTVSLTPSYSNELIINTCGIDAHTLSGLSGTGYLSIIAVAPNFNGGGTGFVSDDGFGHVYSSTATTFLYTVQNQSAGGINGVQGWVSQSSAYR